MLTIATAACTNPPLPNPADLVLVARGLDGLHEHVQRLVVVLHRHREAALVADVARVLAVPPRGLAEGLVTSCVNALSTKFFQAHDRSASLDYRVPRPS